MRLRTIKGAHLLNNNERVRWVSVRSDNSGCPEANKPPSARPLAVYLVWEIYEPPLCSQPPMNRAKKVIVKTKKVVVFILVVKMTELW